MSLVNSSLFFLLLYWVFFAWTGNFSYAAELSNENVIEQSNGSISLEKYGVDSIAKTFRENPNIEINFDIGFAQNSKVLTASGRSVVETLARAMVLVGRENQFEIRGHTDNTGDQSSKKSLSLSRASAVAVLLQNKHSVDNKISTIGFGGTRPVSTNQEANNRISIINRGIDQEAPIAIQ